MEEKSGHEISRRTLLAGAVGGLAIVSGGSALLAGCGSETAQQPDSSTLPWPYVELGPQELARVRQTGYELWYEGFCSYATFTGIVALLSEKVGEPYSSFPTEALVFGHGGTVGWGGTCGTLIGAGMAASLAAGPQRAEVITNEVIKWYSETDLPLGVPEAPRTRIVNVSKSDSSLCHVSVGKWMDREGVAFGSPEQRERCARLSGDVAFKTAEFLNLELRSEFYPTDKGPVAVNGMPSQYNCAQCHQDGTPTVPGRA